MEIDQMNLPLVSIITPSLNQAHFIEQTILSVKGQNYPHIEHIVIDGGSTDGTLDILRSYENEYNLKWTSKIDNGQSCAINTGFKFARGEIVGWLNSDDTYMPETIAIAIRTFQEKPNIGWVYGDSYWIDECGDVLGLWQSKPYNYQLLVSTGQYMAQPTVFFRSRVRTATGFLDESLHHIMDTDFFMRMGLVSDGLYIPRALATRRLHSQAKTVTSTYKFSLEKILLLEKFFQRSDLPGKVMELKRTSLSNAFFYAGRCHYASGFMTKAKSFLIESMLIDAKPLRFDTMKKLLLLLQIYLKFNYYMPGNSKKPDLRFKNVNLNWRKH